MIFLTKEEKTAIKILKEWYNYNTRNKNKLLEVDKIINIRETILNLIEKLEKENKRYKSENETLKCSIAVANKLEELIKEDFIPKGKIGDIIEKISLYKKLAKESIEQGIVIADNDSLEYGRMQAHNVDMSMLQELLKKLESEE